MPKNDKDLEEENNFDEQQFKKLLYKIFPNTKNLKNKIKEMDMIDKKMDEQLLNGIKNNSDSESDTESDSDFNEEDENYQPVNIIVTMGNLDQYDDYYDSDYEEEEWITEDTDSSSEEIENRESPIMTRSKKKLLDYKKNKQSEKKAGSVKKEETVEKKAESVKKEETVEKKAESVEKNIEDSSERYKLTIQNLIENFGDFNTDNKKFNEELKQFLNKEKVKIEEEQKKENEKNEKKKKLKNERTLKKLLKKKRKPIDTFNYFNKLDLQQQNDIIKKFEELDKENTITKPYYFTVIESDIPIQYKSIVMKKLYMFENMEPGASDYYKNKLWVDTFMEIPFSKYSKLPVTMETSTNEEIKEFMNNSLDTLNNVVYGMDDAKLQIMQIIGKWIANPDSIGNAFAISGPPGTGKTTLVKEGISKILNRPFAFIPLGGATDSSYLEGHSYTYEGSVWGKIIQILINSKVMNPVIYFDELDKVSNSPRGEEIIGILTHLTDTTQNSQFHDKYFSGIDFDLSKALFIFSYNDETQINPILKDRMYRINTKGYDNNDKQIISNKYITPNILKSLNFNSEDIIISEEILNYINNNLTENEKGVRNMKRCIETICSKLNIIRLSENTKLLGNDINIKYSLPYTVTIEDVNKLITKNDKEVPINMYT